MLSDGILCPPAASYDRIRSQAKEDFQQAREYLRRANYYHLHAITSFDRRRPWRAIGVIFSIRRVLDMCAHGFRVFFRTADGVWGRSPRFQGWAGKKPVPVAGAPSPADVSGIKKTRRRVRRVFYARWDATFVSRDMSLFPGLVLLGLVIQPDVTVVTALGDLSFP